MFDLFVIVKKNCMIQLKACDAPPYFVNGSPLYSEEKMDQSITCRDVSQTIIGPG